MKTDDTQSALEALGKISAQVAHDMMSPLSVIKVFIQYVPLDTTDPELRALRDVALRSCERLTILADDMLECHKATQIETTCVHISGILRSICDEMEFAASHEGVCLESHVPEMGMILGDGDKLSRVFQNLIRNAIQALVGLPDGKISVRLETHDSGIAVVIRDNGPGVSEDCLQVLFKQGITTKGKCGNGLGLMYCADVVRAHSGQISARNHPEGGAEFRIELP